MRAISMISTVKYHVHTRTHTHTLARTHTHAHTHTRTHTHAHTHAHTHTKEQHFLIFSFHHYFINLFFFCNFPLLSFKYESSVFICAGVFMIESEWWTVSLLSYFRSVYECIRYFERLLRNILWLIPIYFSKHDCRSDRFQIVRDF